jgi:hypothetical protein
MGDVHAIQTIHDRLHADELLVGLQHIVEDPKQRVHDFGELKLRRPIDRPVD